MESRYDDVLNWRNNNPSCTYCKYFHEHFDECIAKDINIGYNKNKRKRVASKCELFKAEERITW